MVAGELSCGAAARSPSAAVKTPRRTPLAGILIPERVICAQAEADGEDGGAAEGEGWSAQRSAQWRKIHVS